MAFGPLPVTEVNHQPVCRSSIAQHLAVADGSGDEKAKRLKLPGCDVLRDERTHEQCYDSTNNKKRNSSSSK